MYQSQYAIYGYEADRDPASRCEVAPPSSFRRRTYSSKIEAYAENPRSQANNVKALQGSTGLRLRVGDFRVVFEETAAEVIVTKIGPRGGIYD